MTEPISHSNEGAIQTNYIKNMVNKCLKAELKVTNSNFML